jgi:hypothetical protein
VIGKSEEEDRGSVEKAPDRYNLKSRETPAHTTLQEGKNKMISFLSFSPPSNTSLAKHQPATQGNRSCQAGPPSVANPQGRVEKGPVNLGSKWMLSSQMASHINQGLLKYLQQPTGPSMDLISCPILLLLIF